MRNVVTIIMAFLGIASCGPRTQLVELSKCWSTSVGEHISGQAVLYAYDDSGCTECGAMLSANGKCRATGIAIGSEQADFILKHLLKASPKNDLDMIAAPVSFSGVTVRSGGKQGLMIRIDRLDAYGGH